MTSSSGTKRAYRKLSSDACTTSAGISGNKKRATHKELRVFIPAALKAQLQDNV
ncbi:RepB family protein [Escherichia coli]